MGSRFAKLESRAAAASFGLLLAFIIVAVSPLLGSTQGFSVPDDVVLRIRLDDTLTSTGSQVGDPFSATVVDEVDLEGAIESGGRGRKTIEHTVIGAGAGALLGGIFGGKGAGVGSVIGGACGLGTTAFH